MLGELQFSPNLGMLRQGCLVLDYVSPAEYKCQLLFGSNLHNPASMSPGELGGAAMTNLRATRRRVRRGRDWIFGTISEPPASDFCAPKPGNHLQGRPKAQRPRSVSDNGSSLHRRPGSLTDDRKWVEDSANGAGRRVGAGHMAMSVIGAGVRPSPVVGRQQMSRLLRMTLLVVVVSSACGAQPGQPGTATGDFDSAVTKVTLGSLRLAFSDGGGACGTREERDAYSRQAGLWVRLLAVDGLELGPHSAAFDLDVSPGAGEMPTLNRFLALAVPSIVEGEQRDISAAPALAGTVSLDAVPDYDTGAVSGSYDIAIDGTGYSGTFNTAYCPTDAGVDTAGIAEDLWRYCDLVPEIPFEPGASYAETDERDRERGINAFGLSDQRGQCMQGVIDSYCKQATPEHWPDYGRGECLEHEFQKCFESTEPPPDFCVE